MHERAASEFVYQLVFTECCVVIASKAVIFLYIFVFDSSFTNINTVICSIVGLSSFRSDDHRTGDQIKMVNGFLYYRALESASIASALSTALTIYPCQIRVHQRWQSKLQLPTARKKELRPPQRAVHPMRLPVNTVIHTTLVGLEPATKYTRVYLPQPSDRWLIVGPTRYQ